LLANGRVDEALPQLERATRLDTLSAVAAGSLALGYGVAHREGDAVRAGARAVALAPDQAVSHVLAGAAALYVGRLPLALQELTTATALDSASMLSTGLLGYAYARSGQAGVARAMRDRAAGEIGRRAGAATAAARISLGLADTAAALGYLERAVRDHDPFLAQESLAAPIYDAVRHSPRFAAVVAGVHLDPRVLQR
jgi:tetratricopeptide (TPR) repeat protein